MVIVFAITLSVLLTTSYFPPASCFGFIFYSTRTKKPLCNAFRPFDAAATIRLPMQLNQNYDLFHDASLIKSSPRRAILQSFFLISTNSVAVAAVDPSTVDKEKIALGYKRLTYLIDNWEAETTVCNTSLDNPYIGCDRKPDKVMEYLGFRNMKDPLFRANKTLIRLQNLIPADDSEAQAEYQDALDTWVEKAEEGSGMAYLSSWGESNPGGGRDRVALFIERSKKDVIDARDSLATVIRLLNISIN